MSATLSPDGDRMVTAAASAVARRELVSWRRAAPSVTARCAIRCVPIKNTGSAHRGEQRNQVMAAEVRPHRIELNGRPQPYRRPR